MEKNSTGTPEASLFDGTAWFDPIEAGVRDRIRGFIETMLEEELTAALGRGRYRRDSEAVGGYRALHHASGPQRRFRPPRHAHSGARRSCLDRAEPYQRGVYG